jgi:hypothetical protein
MQIRKAFALAAVIVCLVGSARAAGDYPLSLTLTAKIATEETTITSRVTVKVDYLMRESQRTRVLDALKYNGYGSFLASLRALPAVGTISLPKRSVTIRYAWETAEESGRRIVLVADSPLVFLGDPSKSRAGYELSMAELHVDAKGAVTGTMAGAARVKPSPDGIVLDVYEEAPVQLTGRTAR